MLTISVIAGHLHVSPVRIQRMVDAGTCPMWRSPTGPDGPRYWTTDDLDEWREILDSIINDRSDPGMEHIATIMGRVLDDVARRVLSHLEPDQAA